jgi:valyl-tRNA synthetase
MIFNEEEMEIEHIIDFIKVFRNIKQENNIGKEFKIKIENSDDLIIKMLKLTDHITEESIEMTKYHITNNYYSLDLYHEKVLTENDRLLKEKQIETLKSNIARREKLLSNPGYVNKAPKELVESEKEKLENEKTLLEKLLNE